MRPKTHNEAAVGEEGSMFHRPKEGGGGRARGGGGRRTDDAGYRAINPREIGRPAAEPPAAIGLWGFRPPPDDGKDEREGAGGGPVYGGLWLHKIHA